MPPLVEALLLAGGALALCGVWYSARRRDRPAAQALRQNEERFRQLTALSADWFWETDAEYRLSWLSGGPAMAALFSGTGADITARKQAEERIQYLATRDALTGFPNRALLADRAAGDALLRAVAERLAATLRRDDTLARLDGGEFALLWNGVKDAQDAAALAQRAVATLASPFTIEGHALDVTASIGISVYPQDGRDFGELLRNASAATHRKRPVLVLGEPRSDSNG